MNKESRYQLTVIGSFAQAIISKEVSNNKFEIDISISNVKVRWEVKAVRNDNCMKQHPFVAEQEKLADSKGKYWDPASHNKPESKGVGYDAKLGGLSLNFTSKSTPLDKEVISEHSSLDQAIIPAARVNAAKNNTGSVLDIPVNTKAQKGIVIDNNGSVANEAKKEEKKKVLQTTEKGSIDQ